MKIPGLIRACFIAVSALIGVAAFSAQALAWGWAAHAYITGRVVHKDKANAIYGSTVPDMFQYEFDNPCLSSMLDDKTHNEPMPAWKEAAARHSKPLMAAALGLVAHNGLWGEDATAHHDGITYGRGKGYVIAKAEQLKQLLQQVPEFQALGVPDGPAMEIAHEILEDGIDILVTRLDKKVGRRISTAARGRTKKFPLLIARTYCTDLASCSGISESQARAEIIRAESNWRSRMIAYGAMLSKDEATQVRLMSEQVAESAGGFLASNGITTPPGTDLTPLIQFALTAAMDLCKADFKAELDATARAVAVNLDANGVSY